MWGRKKKARAQEHTVEIQSAQRGQARAAAVIALVEAQQDEVTERVDRLRLRDRRNNFGEALVESMARRAAG